MLRWPALGFAAIALAFVLSSLPYLALLPGDDDWKNLWLVQNIPFWRFLSEPLAAGYTFRFYFEPTWPLSYYPDLWLAPVLGTVGHHLVNVIAALGVAFVLTRLVAAAGGSPRVALGTAAIFLFSPPVWFAVGFGAARNYLIATFFALLALLPFWRAAFAGAPCRAFGIGASALFYALAVGSKESTASLPLLLFFLDLRSGRRPWRAVAHMLPHAAALGGLLLWRTHILGGFGGYWMEPSLTWSNLLDAVPMLADFLWGTRWLLVLFAPLLWIRRDLTLTFAVAYLSCFSPFVLAGDLTDGPEHPIPAVRFLLFWALSLAFAGPAASAAMTARGLHRTRVAVLVAVGALAVGIQWTQRGVLDAAFPRLLPTAPLAAETVDGGVGTEIVSGHSKSLIYAHQLGPADRAPLVAYQTPPSYQLARALGIVPPPGSIQRKIRPDWIAPELVPLELGRSRIWADASGHLRIRLDDGLEEGLSLTWIHENGPTRWVTTLPVGRREIDFPLTYSIRKIVLARLAPTTQRWEVFVWDSPYFRPAFP